jgi:hypothetical protein
MASTQLIPEPIEKCAVCAESPRSTIVAGASALVVTVGKRARLRAAYEVALQRASQKRPLSLVLPVPRCQASLAGI